jgi:hypothetical protein
MQLPIYKRRAGGAHPLLLPTYSCLHQDVQSLATDELPRLIRAIDLHQQELRVEGNLAINLGTPAASRPEAVGRRGVPADSRGPMALPPIPVPQ